MLIFVINWISSAIEILKPPSAVGDLVPPSLFFATMVGFYAGFNMLGWFTLGLCFVLKILIGSARLIILLWVPGERVFYFLAMLETFILWLILNPLLI